MTFSWSSRQALPIVSILLVCAGPGGAAHAAGPAVSIHGYAVWVAPPALQLRLPPPARRPIRAALPRPESELPQSEAPRRSAKPIRPRAVSAVANAPTVQYSQQGISEVDAGAQWSPADVTIGVGTSYVGEAVNASVGWWLRDRGYSLSSVESLGSFFTTTAADRRTDAMGDPRLLYDPRSGRWFFVAFDVTRNETDLAVSATDDPTQSWVIYALAAAGCPDQPRIAVSDTMLALSYDLFSSCTTRVPPYVGGVTELFDKQALLAGQAPAASAYGPDSRFTAITPASPLDGGASVFLVSTDYTLSQIVLYAASAVGESSLPLQRIPIRLLRRSPPSAQMGSTVALDTGDNRVQDAFAEHGVIWLAANDGCTVFGSSALQGCLRYVELSTGGRVIVEREEALANSRSALYPAFRPDAGGNLISVYGYSSANDSPSLAATIDPGRTSGYVQLKAGESADESGRWGDYFTATRDPLDGSRVWVAGAYGRAGGWGTYIAALSASDPSNPPPPTTDAPADTEPPTAKALPSIGRAGLPAHLRYRLFDKSERLRERIRIRNRGSLVATVRTELSRIQNGSTYFALWRPPRGARGGFSFCVTAYDATGNASRPSCAALRVR